jgi:beta-aspartyl-peptidase (threonine type)
VATLIVHGGAGRLHPGADRGGIDAGLGRALDAGWRAMSEGALAAAVAAVTVLEDDPHFNAGTGAVLTSEGEVELDAGVMTADRLRAGAVAGMTDAANPVKVARAVLEDGRHVLLCGAGASRFAAERGLPRLDPQRLREASRRAGARHGEPSRVAGAGEDQRTAGGGSPGGTVGAVCRDGGGGLAVAVSTGGIAGKLPGRIGDSALCGAGFYADTPGAACATGEGEAFIRLVGCRRAVELMAAGADAQTAAAQLIELLGQRTQGTGGIIVVDATGSAGVAHSTPDMPWAWRSEAAAARW